jgi:hypothetical protein
LLKGVKMTITKQHGQVVKILGGMREFVGQKGHIVDIEKQHGQPTMYRVKLFDPVEIEGVGEVTDDLWEGRFLRNARM